MTRRAPAGNRPWRAPESQGLEARSSWLRRNMRACRSCTRENLVRHAFLRGSRQDCPTALAVRQCSGDFDPERPWVCCAVCDQEVSKRNRVGLANRRASIPRSPSIWILDRSSLAGGCSDPLTRTIGIGSVERVGVLATLARPAADNARHAAEHEQASNAQSSLSHLTSPSACLSLENRPMWFAQANRCCCHRHR